MSALLAGAVAGAVAGTRFAQQTCACCVLVWQISHNTVRACAGKLSQGWVRGLQV